jgi:ribulose 1,5-bisphosphate carboxylase large subunit-like protein
MVKELYDPNMFNYMWESLDQDRFVVGTYYIEDNKPDWDFIDHLGQVQRLALEGSTASWMEVKEETPEVRERLSSKVLGYYEIPSPKGTKRAVVQLAFPTAAWDVNVNMPMLLLSISGNIFAFCDQVRLLDVYACSTCISLNRLPPSSTALSLASTACASYWEFTIVRFACRSLSPRWV